MVDKSQKRSFYITVIPSCQLLEIVLFFGAKYVCYRNIMCYSHYISGLDPIELQSGYDVNESLLVGFGGKDTLKIVHSRLKFHNPMQLYLFSTVN